MSTRMTLFCLLSTASLSFAQARLPGDESAERFLKEDTRIVSGRFLDGAKTLKEWQDRLPRLRREHLDMLGLWPLPPRTPLNAAITGTLTRDDVAIEKLHFQSKPGLYVTGNLYRPKVTPKRLPAILYVCGHSGRGRDGNKTAFQDHGMWFARNGYVCLVIDTLQLGEIAGKHHGTYNLNRWWWHSLAYTPAGVECWNGIRAIDYLVSRDDVDPEKIGVTGISGGGASTIWIAAADERVKVAVPVSGMSDLESYVSNKVINGHCDCMFLVNLYRWEWTTIAALIAPRPMLFANSDNDRIFPMDGNRRIIARLREAYKMHGRPDLVDEYVSVGGHDYRPDLRIAVFRWINKHLKGDDGAVKDATDAPLPGKELRVFPEDRDVPADAINGRIDETFIAKAEVKLPEAGKFAEWQKGMLARLREGPFRNLGDVTAAKAGEIFHENGFGTGLSPWKKRLITEGSVQSTFHSGTFLRPPLRYIRAGNDHKETYALLIVDDSRVSDLEAIKNARLVDNPRYFALEPRGIGELDWTRRSPPNYVERSYALLGRTVDLGRVHDILSTWEALANPNQSSWRIVGRGKAGIIAAFAALLDPRISEVILIDPPASHRDGPHFLGIQRVLDIPEALGLLAPRKLTLIGAIHPGFDRTEAIYKLAGAADKLARTSPPRIDPIGVQGGLVIADEGNDAVLQRFVELAGGKKAMIAIVTPNEKEDTLAEKLKPAQVRHWRSGSALFPDIKGVTGVWINGPGVRDSDIEQLLKQGILVGSPKQWAKPLAANLPSSKVEPVLGDRGEAPKHGQIGYDIEPNSALVVRGRRLTVAGPGKVSIYLRECLSRPEKKIELSGNQVQDLTALRRSARDRAESFPPAKVRDPVVENGTLVIIGGGGMPAGMVNKFVELAGGKEAKIVVLPTATPNPPANDRFAGALRRAGAKKVTVLPGNTPDKVESPEYLDAMREATGIWFGGGRQWHFVDAYEHTKLLPLMHDVLKRGGVIGGSSAGATIQGEYLCRGGVFNNFDIAYEGYERGFAFLPGVAIDQHFAQRKRFADMTKLMKLFPQYLGIGLDEATAIVVKGSTADVVGRGQAHFYDAKKPAEKGKPDHDSLGDGGRYDLKARKVLLDKKP